MAAHIAWGAYLILAFLAAPALFRLRWGRWPFAYALPPRDAYTLVDLAFGAALALYTAALYLGPAPEPVSVAWGLAIFIAGYALQVWAIVEMGRHWRIGQDARDETVEYVARGPFPLLKHPIYVSLIMIAIGQTLLAGFDGRSFLLVMASVIYFCVQGRAETLEWRKRSRSQSDASAPGDG
ncbi:MAG: hypothetical protein EA376_12815 [Phycisphaeraceae bacterium]|nr:MAG: hypothetical protein EA376_12815 [Phycisphaeraceae bacterium]